MDGCGGGLSGLMDGEDGEEEEEEFMVCLDFGCFIKRASQ